MQAISLKNRMNLLYCIIAGVYAGFLLAIIQRTGIVSINEAAKYIFAAKNILAGGFKETIQSHFFYSGYIGFLTLVLLVGNIKLAVIVQGILCFSAGIYIKKILDHLQGYQAVSITGMLLFLFCYPIQIWTVTLFSESFFISISIITLYYTLKEKSAMDMVVWLLLNALLLVSRPPGIFLVLPFILFGLRLNNIVTRKATIFLYILSFISLLLAIFLIPVQNKGYVNPVAAGRIIVDSSNFTVPGFTSEEKSNLATAYHFLHKKNGSLYITKLYLKKTISFFTLTRPYYSRAHNNAARFFYLLYPLSLLGMLAFIKQNRKEIALLFAASCFGIVNLVAITFNEWHYRFTVTIFPFLIVLTMIGISAAYDGYLRLTPLIKKNET
jgi:hypothetical protein